MIEGKRQISAFRAVLGLLAGATTGAFLVASFAIVESWVSSGFSIPPNIALGTAIAVYAGVVWAAGLFLVAPLPWYLLHRSGFRGWPTAMALGFVATFVAVMAALTRGFGLFPRFSFSASDNGGATWIDGKLTLHGWTQAIEAALVCGLAGALVGLTVWTISYRRTGR